MSEDQNHSDPKKMLAAKETPKKDSPQEASRLQRFKTWYKDRKRWSIPATVLLVILLLAAIPFTRYSIAGLAIKHDLTVKVLDAGSHTPVSGATVGLAGQTAQTDSNGTAILRHVKAGHHQVVISKKYYQEATIDALSPVVGHVNAPSVELTATGRQVKITVTNLINKSALADVTIKVAGITAKTDQKGTALVVLPAGIAEQKAQLSANGFNDGNVTIKINGTAQDNSFNLTPAGKIYFLSKLSGKIDVVKTNLDGTGRQTVLAGTGNEDDRHTVLLASRDWKYLALLSQRAGNRPTLYLIDTSNDQLTIMDQGNAAFTLDGWAGHKFIYTVDRNDVQPWQSGQQTLKSYDAESQKITTLDQTTAQGTSQNDYAGETYGSVYIIGDTVFYSKTWQASYNLEALFDKKAGIYSVLTSGKNKATLKSFAQMGGYTFIDSISYKPDEIYFRENQSGVVGINYFEYSDGKLTANNNLEKEYSQYQQEPTTYLVSPSGNNTFWSEPRDGKNTLLVGDQDGEKGNQVATLSDYSTYGWFTDDYLLVSKNNSELYIMDSGAKQTPVKISDYHKPAVTFQGYGGGYGGL